MSVPVVSRPRRARPADLTQARELLRSAGLPVAGVDEHFESFWTVRNAGRIVGVVGAERYGATWLLRSLVVDPGFRGDGIGGALLAAVVAEARRLGVHALFLLTMDAQEFFAARGFTSVSRADAPVALRESEELRGACPDSATLMRFEVAR